MIEKISGYLISAFVFAVVFGALGFIGFAASTGATGGWSVSGWLRFHGDDAALWGSAGALVGFGVRYLITHR